MPLTSPIRVLLSLLVLLRSGMALRISSIEHLTTTAWDRSAEVLEVLGYGLCCEPEGLAAPAALIATLA